MEKWKRRLKRTAAIFLAVLLIGNTIDKSAFAVSAAGETTASEGDTVTALTFRLWVNGTPVTGSAGSTEGYTLNDAAAGWSYAPATGTLTLTNAALTNGEGPYGAAIYWEGGDLTIELVGANTVDVDWKYPIFYKSDTNDRTLTIKGPGSLNVDGGIYQEYSTGEGTIAITEGAMVNTTEISGLGNVIISDSTVIADGSGWAGIYSEADVTITNSYVVAKSGDGSGIQVHGDLTITNSQVEIMGTQRDIANAQEENFSDSIVTVSTETTVTGNATLRSDLTTDAITFEDGATLTRGDYTVTAETVTGHEHNQDGEITYTYINQTLHTRNVACKDCPIGYVTATRKAHSTTEAEDKAATCQEKAYCSVCQQFYGEWNTTNHTGSLEYADNGNGTHTGKYSCCLGETSAEKHSLTYTADDDTIFAECDACKATGTITLTAEGGTYNGSPYTAAYGTPMGLLADVTPDITYKKGDTTLEAAPDQAGIYTATIALGGKTVSVEFEINALSLASDIVSLSADRVICNGQEQKPTITVMGLTEGTDYTVTFPEDMTNPGEKTIAINGIGNYTGTVTETFIIARPITVTAEAQTIVVNGTPDGSKVTVSGSYGLAEGHTISVTYVPVDTSTIGEKTLIIDTVTILDAAGRDVTDSYSVTKQTGILTVEEHKHSWFYSASGPTIIATCGKPDECPIDTAAITLNAPAELTYDGASKEAVISGTIGDVVLPEITYSGDNLADGKSVNAGTYTASITVGNETVSVEYIIKQAKPDIGSVSAGMVENTLDVSQVLLSRTDNALAGTLALTDSTLQYGTHIYNWKFTPDDIINYETITGTVEITVTDTIAPTAVYQIGTDGWKEFENNSTFGLFCRDYNTVEIRYSDGENGSGIAEKQYYVSNEEISDTSNISWENYTGTISLDAAETYFIYVRVVDNAGREIILNSEGIVIYAESVIENAAIDYTYKQNQACNVKMNLNGNTIKAIKDNAGNVLADSDYTVSDSGDIFLQASYLNTLKVDEYTYKVYLNPMGIETDTVELVSTFEINVKPAELTVKEAAATDKIYDGTKEVVITGVTLDGMVSNEDVSVDVTGTKGALSSANVGEYTSVTLPALTLTGTAAGNYTLIQPTEAVSTSVSITPASAEIMVGTDTYSMTYGDAAFTLDVTDTNTEAEVQYEVTAGTDVVTVSNGTVSILNAGTAAITVSLPASENFQAATSQTITVNIEKAEAYTIEAINKEYVYTAGSDGMVSINLAKLLRADRGITTYSLEDNTAVYVVDEAVSTDGMLSFAVNTSGSVGDATALTVKAVSGNYKDVTIKVNITLKDKLVTVEKTDAKVAVSDTLTYGETLSELALNLESAVFVVDGTDTVVEGTLAWVTPDAVPNTGTTTAQWKFTPKDAATYTEVTGNVVIVVNQATPYVEILPVAKAITYGDTLAEAVLLGGKAVACEGSTTMVEGSFAWKTESMAPVVADSNTTAYSLVFTPVDTVNYKTVTTAMTVTVNKAEDAPNMPEAVMNVENSVNTVSAITLPEDWTWQSGAENTALTPGVAANVTAVYTGADAGNYKNETVIIAITRAMPIVTPTAAPTPVPTAVPTSVPTAAPTPVLTAVPTSVPTAAPTSVPTAAPTPVPTAVPTSVPTAVPTSVPTVAPTSVPTPVPTAVPTSVPTAVPTSVPTAVPTSVPTAVPTSVPTAVPTSVPTVAPTSVPTAVPTAAPTSVPTVAPTAVPTAAPTSVPTEAPTSVPTAVPTSVPTAVPTAEPTPTAIPSQKPAAVPVPTLADSGKPFIQNDAGKIGWSVIRGEIAVAEEGETIVVDMAGTTTVPGDVFSDIKGRDITMTFDMGSGLSWTVNGKSVTADKVSDIDFAVKVGTEADPLNNIPVEVINKVTGERYFVNISLVYDGEFGFTAILNINLKSENAGLFANLFYYNEAYGVMQFVWADDIDEYGTAHLVFTHASEYTIVIDEGILKADVTAPKTGDEALPLSLTAAAMLTMGLGFCLLAKKRREE